LILKDSQVVLQFLISGVQQNCSRRTT